MRYAICIEEMEGRWIAHVSTLPGCFASAGDRATAQSLAPNAIRAYGDWRQAHGDQAIPLDAAIEVDVEEIVREWAHPAEPDYAVNAFFAADAPPLARADVDLALRLLDWTRADLFAAFQDLPPDALRRPVEGEWTIGGILNHVSRAEWWYLDRLELAPPTDQEPDNWRERLDVARARLREVLPRLEGVARVELRAGEVWSPRKMLRRALWHERDHTQHILQFRERLGV
jgi:predicted RNase H-like HicB family nuclease